MIDEADRMMEEIKQDWLTQLEKAVYTARGGAPQPLTVARYVLLVLLALLQQQLFNANSYYWNVANTTINSIHVVEGYCGNHWKVGY